jgi:hypothetical protein
LQGARAGLKKPLPSPFEPRLQPWLFHVGSLQHLAFVVLGARIEPVVYIVKPVADSATDSNKRRADFSMTPALNRLTRDIQSA